MKPEELKEIFGTATEKEKEKVGPKEKEDEFKYAENRRAIDEKRAELELKKLDIEIENLKKPDTKVDYFEKMLSLQQTNFSQMLEMQKSQMTLQLEIEKLKIGEGGEDLSWLKDLIPYLPQILKKQETPQSPPNYSAEKPLQSPTIKEKKKVKSKQGGEKMDKLEVYKQKIRKGEISEEQALKDFKKQEPLKSKLISKEEFHKIFEDIKAGKNGI